MKRDEEIEAARLLSGKDEPSVLEKEAILQGALLDSGLERRRSWSQRALAVASVAVAASFVVFMSSPELMGLGEVDEFSARSGGDGGATLETICQPGPACESGSKLLLRVSNAAPEAKYLAAFSRAEDGTVVWYFPNAEGDMSLNVTQGKWSEEAVVLGNEHAPGTYTVYGLLSDQPLTRDMVKARVESDGGDADLLKSEFEVAP